MSLSNACCVTIVHQLSGVRTGHQDADQSEKPLLNKCFFVGCAASGPMPSFYQHLIAFRVCINSHCVGPTAQQVGARGIC